LVYPSCENGKTYIGQDKKNDKNIPETGEKQTPKKIKDFIKVMDVGLDEAEREYLRELIVSGMYQSFCYGYSIGKIEGKSENRILI